MWMLEKKQTIFDIVLVLLQICDKYYISNKQQSLLFLIFVLLLF